VQRPAYEKEGENWGWKLLSYDNAVLGGASSMGSRSGGTKQKWKVDFQTELRRQDLGTQGIKNRGRSREVLNFG